MRKIPRAAVLLKTPVAISANHFPDNRHLVAAGILAGIELQIRLEHQLIEQPEPDDILILLEMRHTKGFGALGGVSCPGCDDVEDDEVCAWCAGVGLVSIDKWDAWYEQERGCLSHSEGCEKICKRTNCSQDELGVVLDVPVLILESRKLGGQWKKCGDNIDGFKLKGLAFNTTALARYLSLVSASFGLGPVDAD